MALVRYLLWFYRSEVWKNVSDKDKSMMELVIENDGEFWCGIMLFCLYFFWKHCRFRGISIKQYVTKFVYVKGKYTEIQKHNPNYEKLLIIIWVDIIAELLIVRL